MVVGLTQILHCGGMGDWLQSPRNSSILLNLNLFLQLKLLGWIVLERSALYLFWLILGWLTFKTLPNASSCPTNFLQSEWLDRRCKPSLVAYARTLRRFLCHVFLASERWQCARLGTAASPGVPGLAIHPRFVQSIPRYCNWVRFLWRSKFKF